MSLEDIYYTEDYYNRGKIVDGAFMVMVLLLLIPTVFIDVLGLLLRLLILTVLFFVFFKINGKTVKNRVVYHERDIENVKWINRHVRAVDKVETSDKWLFFGVILFATVISVLIDPYSFFGREILVALFFVCALSLVTFLLFGLRLIYKMEPIDSIEEGKKLVDGE